MVSACLLGENCKYSGGNNRNDALLAALKIHDGVKTEPVHFSETLMLPRARSLHRVRLTALTAVISFRLITNGIQMLSVRDILFHRIFREQPEVIILQSRSPSCGVREIYDGTFKGKLVPGEGIFAAMARAAGFHVCDAEEFLSGFYA